MRVKTILMYFRKNTADNLTFNVELVELVNGDLEVVVKVVEVQKNVQDVLREGSEDRKTGFSRFPSRHFITSVSC
mgnify:CR=1 FL=1